MESFSTQASFHFAFSCFQLLCLPEVHCLQLLLSQKCSEGEVGSVTVQGAKADLGQDRREQLGAMHK